MKLNNYINSKVTYLSLTGLILLGLTSCGSYQSATYEDDGIYSSNEPRQEVAVRETKQVAVQDTKSQAYQDYFKRESDRYEDITEDDIFVDVDSLGYGDDEMMKNMLKVILLGNIQIMLP